MKGEIIRTKSALNYLHLTKKRNRHTQNIHPTIPTYNYPNEK